MTEDSRESRSAVSGIADIPSQNGDNFPIIELREPESVSVGYLKIDYPDSAEGHTLVEIGDRHEDDEEGEVVDVDMFNVAPGDTIILEDPVYRDIANGLYANTDGENDQPVIVTAGAMKITG